MKSTKLNNIQALFGGQDMFGAELLPSRFTCGNLAQDEAAFSSAGGKWAKSGLHRQFSELTLLAELLLAARPLLHTSAAASNHDNRKGKAECRRRT